MLLTFYYLSVSNKGIIIIDLTVYKQTLRIEYLVNLLCGGDQIKSTLMVVL